MVKVKVYTKYGCPQCDMTKRVLEGEGIGYETINIQDDSEAFDFVVNTLGYRQMPVVVAEGHEPFAGFQPDKLKELK